MIAFTIEAAKASKQIGRVFVSTDDPTIAQVARDYGAEVIDRPRELASDTASSESALLHALDHLEQTEGYLPELLVFLQCTSPLTATADIDGTIDALLDQHAQTAVAVTPFHYFVWKTDEQEGATGVNHDKAFRPRRQDREPQYLETGAVYVMRAAEFRVKKHRFFGKTAMHVMPEHRVHEIDEPVDLSVAEVLLREAQRESKLERLPERVAGLVMDFDGVFTDNRVHVDQAGVESVACSRSDGYGLEQLRKAGLPMVVISKERNPVVQRRCDKLVIPCLQGIDEKRGELLRWCEAQQLDLESVVYIGNDVNDLDCLEVAGCAVVVADAHPIAQNAADIVLSAVGGQGALRELSELILDRNKA
jgi:N-acylneuraminate cytidylyltransferase